MHTPALHVTAPNVPLVAVTLKSAGVAFVTGFPNLSFTVMVTTAVAFAAILVALMLTVDLAALGTSGMMTMLRRITTRPAESASVLSPDGVLRTPVSVDERAVSSGVQTAAARPLAFTCAESGAGPKDVPKRS